MTDVVWSRRIADELWSGLVTPLTYDLLAEPMAEHLVRLRLRRAGLAAAAERSVFRLAWGHVYVNASLVAEVMREVPSIFVSEGLLELLPESLRGEVRESDRSLIGAQTIGTVLQLSWNERAWMPWARAALFRREAADATAAFLALRVAAGAGESEILAALDQAQARLGKYLEVVSWGMIYAFVFFHLLSQMLERWAPGEGASIAPLTSGLAGIRTFEVHDELIACAETARRDAGLRRIVLEGHVTETLARCQTEELGRFGRQFRSLIARHGHRLLGRDLRFPTWRERPELVLETIQRLIRSGPVPGAAERGERREAMRRRVLARISGGPAGVVRRELFLRGLAWCQDYYALRENMRYHADAFLAALRSLALAAGERLHAAGLLAEGGDVFYLTEAELRTALEGLRRDAAPADTALRARSRRQEYETLAGTSPPAELYGDAEGPGARTPSLAADPAGRAAAMLLRGLGVSPGRMEGPARVVRTVEELHGLRAGEVVVAPMTDPSWTSLLALGGALVLEVGGLLSHGAIVARELGIPAVVDLPAATSLLSTGDVLAVDGAAGTVGRRGEPRRPAQR